MENESKRKEEPPWLSYIPSYTLIFVVDIFIVQPKLGLPIKV